MIEFAADGILSFSFAPLRLATWTGFAAIGVALAGVIYAVLLRLLTTDWVRGWSSLFVAILFMGGVQLIFLGIIGEYIGRIYGEVKQRPLYFVSERLGFERENHQTRVRQPSASPVQEEMELSSLVKTVRR